VKPAWPAELLRQERMVELSCLWEPLPADVPGASPRRQAEPQVFLLLVPQAQP